MNKITKLLSVFVLAGAVGMGAAGIAACTKTPEHVHNYTYVDDENGKHHQHCDVEGCDAPDLAAEDHTWGANDKCDKCGADKPATTFEVPADVTGLLVEYAGSAEVTLSETNKSCTIAKSDVKVYFTKGANNEKGDEVPAANLVLTLTMADGTPVSSWENITKDGEYKINASVQNVTMATGSDYIPEDLVAAATVKINNPIKADSLAVKEGTKTQPASVQDKISSTWKYEVTLANGDKMDYTEPVTISMDTTKVGEQTVTLTSGKITGSVTVTITASNLRIETYAVNFNNYNGDIATQEPGTAEAPTSPVTLFESAGGTTKLEARGLKAEANSNNRANECDGKYFKMRAPFAGATFTAAGALQTNQRYFILTTEGAAKLTIYWSRNSNNDERGVSVFNSTVAGGDISTLTTSSTPIAKNTVASGAADGGQAIQKMEVNLSEAGTYWITTANNQNAYFYYIELSTEFEEAGDNVTLEDGAKELAKIDVSHEDDTSEAAYVQEFDLGAKFTVEQRYTIEGIFIAHNTAKKTVEELTTGLTYWIGTTQLTPDTTELTADIITLGENTVTVKYNDEAVTGSYKIKVVNAVGVNSVTVALKDDVVTKVAAGGKVNIKWDSFTLTTVGENTNVNVAITSVTYKPKAGGAETAIAEAGTDIPAGEYEVTFNVTVTDKSDTTKSATYTATCALSIKVDATIVSWLYQSAHATPAENDPGLEAEGTIVDNATFTAKALDSAKAGENRKPGEFTGKINDNSNTVPGANKPVAAAENTASGSAITFTNALSFDTKPGATGKDYIEITANKDITVYVYLNGSDDSHGSNRLNNSFTYKIGDNGTVTEVAMTERKNVVVIKVDLTASQKLIIGAKKGTGTDPRVWFYGIEAVEAAATPTSVVIGSDQLTTGEITAKTEIVPGVSIIADATNNVTIEADSKTFTNDADATQDRSFTKRLKLNGSGSATKRAIEIVATGKAKIVVYAISASGSAERTLAFSNGTAELGTMTCPGTGLARQEFSVTEAGTFYLYSKSSGINIYGIEIIYE